MPCTSLFRSGRKWLQPIRNLSLTKLKELRRILLYQAMISKSFAVWILLGFFSTSFVVRAADPIQLPNGLAITPYAAPHSVLLPLKPGLADRPDFTLGQGVTAALSPDGRLLLVLTSGYNHRNAGASHRANMFWYTT